MRKTEQAAKPGERKRKLLLALCMAAVSMLITMIFLLGLSFAIANGYLSMERSETMVMLSALFAAALTAFAFCAREGRGAVLTGLAASAMYCLLLLLLELACGTRALLGLEFFKNAICGCAGLLFGCALFAFRKPKLKRRNFKYNRT